LREIIMNLIAILILSILVACSNTDEENGSTGPDITGQPDTDYTAGEQITVDLIDGLYNDTSIYTDSLITFHIRLNNNTPDQIDGFTMGFRVFSYQNSATWDNTLGQFTDVISDDVISTLFATHKSVTGSNADTIGFGGVNITGTGILSGFNDHAFTIQVGPIPSSHHGGWICLDTAFYPPGGAWLWSTSGGSITPDWDGPRWFRVVNPASGN